MIYTIKYTHQFKKDLKLAKKQGKDLNALYEVIEALSDRILLESSYRNHRLNGEFGNYYECHIEPDWLLLYEISEEEAILSLVRTGSHSDLFR
ncbi:MAG: type II toxin-antitoxin system YafQ family toxin [Erysipelotrichaceae bacterium]|nr:type II toxin-antitoxin system YafQ family toxin [Erysipelotrichaceae bacterium]